MCVCSNSIRRSQFVTRNCVGPLASTERDQNYKKRVRSSIRTLWCVVCCGRCPFCLDKIARYRTEDEMSPADNSTMMIDSSTDHDDGLCGCGQEYDQQDYDPHCYENPVNESRTTSNSSSSSSSSSGSTMRHGSSNSNSSGGSSSSSSNISYSNSSSSSSSSSSNCIDSARYEETTGLSASLGSYIYHISGPVAGSKKP